MPQRAQRALASGFATQRDRRGQQGGKEPDCWGPSAGSGSGRACSFRTSSGVKLGAFMTAS